MVSSHVLSSGILTQVRQLGTKYSCSSNVSHDATKNVLRASDQLTSYVNVYNAEITK